MFLLTGLRSLCATERAEGCVGDHDDGNVSFDLLPV